jgi:hypothetical protein
VLERVDLSSHRIRIRCVCESISSEPCELTLEQLGDTIVASISKAGFVSALDAEQRQTFENALAVFYHRAEVRWVREQVEAELGADAHYAITAEGLVVWPDGGYEVELLYRPPAYRPRPLKPYPVSPVSSRVLDSRRVLYSHQPISWADWALAWRAYHDCAEPVRRLLLGPSLLP